MKKILFVLAATMFGAASWAQSSLQFVDSEGNEIKSGTTLNMVNVEDDGWGTYQIPLKGVSIKNTSFATQSFSMTANVTALPTETSFNCCFGMNCRTQDKTGVMTLTGLSIDGGTTTAIANTEWMMGETENEGACTVVLTITGGPSITINFDKNASGVEAIQGTNGAKSSAVYNLKGQRVDSHTNGVKILDGKKVL